MFHRLPPFLGRFQSKLSLREGGRVIRKLAGEAQHIASNWIPFGDSTGIRKPLRLRTLSS